MWEVQGGTVSGGNISHHDLHRPAKLLRANLFPVSVSEHLLTVNDKKGCTFNKRLKTALFIELSTRTILSDG
jgi:hypothetical protein